MDDDGKWIEFTLMPEDLTQEIPPTNGGTAPTLGTDGTMTFQPADGSRRLLNLAESGDYIQIAPEVTNAAKDSTNGVAIAMIVGFAGVMIHKYYNRK